MVAKIRKTDARNFKTANKEGGRGDEAGYIYYHHIPIKTI